jgi:hypothetical protein
MATTANDFKRIRTRYPGKLDDGVDQYVGDVWPPAYTAQTDSVDLDGSTEKFVNSSDSAIFNDSTWTIAIWAKKDEVWIGGGQLLRLHGSGYAGTLQMEISSANEGRMDVSVYSSTGGAGGRHWWRYDSTWSLGVWTHLVITHDGPASETYFYVDNVQRGSDTDTLTFAAIDRQVNQLGNAFPGRLHTFAYWDTVLDADSRTVVYNSGDSDIDLNEDSGNYDNSGNLTAWYRLGHDSGADTNLGYNYSAVTADADSSNVMDNASNITTADVVTDAP